MNRSIIIHIKPTNMGALRRMLMNASPELKMRIKNVLMLGAVNIAKNARANAPVKTGDLQKNIVAEPTIDGAKVTLGIFYGPYQEFGTKYIKPKLFLTNAFNAEKPVIRSDILAAIRRYFEEVRV